MTLLLCRFLGIPLTPDAGNRTTEQTFSLYLLSIGGELRLQMHNTWLFLGAFGALGFAGLLWVMAEKWQRRSKWNQHDVLWMAAFEALLGCGAILYRLGTHSALAGRFAISGAITDVLGIAIAVAVPVILWFRWHGAHQETSYQEDEDSRSGVRFSRTILGLQDYSPPTIPTNRVSEPKESIATDTSAATQPPVKQPAEWLERTLPKQNEPAEEQTTNEAIVMENMNVFNIPSQPLTSQPTPAQTEAAPQFTAQLATPQPPMTQPVAPPMATSQPMAVQPVAAQPVTTAVQERANLPAITFREQLFALNASWQRIEDTGKEVEDWFQRQQKRVMAHLERPAVKSQDNHPELSRDFLEQRMDRVDAEWAAIHKTVRELHRWLENGNSEREVSQETKVW